MVVERGYAAACHEFELAGAQAEVVAGGCGYGVYAVGDKGGSDCFGMAQAATVEGAGFFVDGAEIAVAAGLRDHRAAGVDAGAGKEVFVDGPFEPEDRTAGVADGGEASLQGFPGFPAGSELGVGSVGGQ